ncbi:hypothetical protein GS493_24805 [Rhodococcus hoagii]|nr:hypothetical protein [Prescottella equi]
MTVTPRERAREQTLAEITASAASNLATHGAAALSLRPSPRSRGGGRRRCTGTSPAATNC